MHANIRGDVPTPLLQSKDNRSGWPGELRHGEA